MQYNSFLYLLPFLLSCVLLYYIIPKKVRWQILLLFSGLFYVFAMRTATIMLLFSSLTFYLGGLFIGKKRIQFDEVKRELSRDERKICKQKMNKYNAYCCGAVCVCNLSILFLTKYYLFFVTNLTSAFKYFGWILEMPKVSLVVPLGISFYTFSAISYIVDVSNGVCRAEKNYFRLLLFMIFFPVITEGPISRYDQLGRELKEECVFCPQDFCHGMQLILWGLFQKVLLSDRVNLYVTSIFRNYKNYNGLPVVLGILLYTFQLYMDFAGCINIARGSAQLFGIYLEENFKRPFFAKTVSEFWRRWHISLGNWFRDYVFYPVSLMKGFQNLTKMCTKRMNKYYASVFPLLLALFVVWLSTGIWHGAEWKYVVYGLYYYLIMVCGILLEPVFVVVIEKLKINRTGTCFQMFQILRTFILVNIGMLIFRSKDLMNAIDMLRSVFKPCLKHDGIKKIAYDIGNLQGADFLLIICGVCVLIFAGIQQEKGICIREYIDRQNLLVRWFIYLIPIMLILICGAYGRGWGAADFIYAKF